MYRNIRSGSAATLSADNAEVGHIHHGGAVHIPFPNPLHDELLVQELAETHQYAPDRMVSFRIQSADDVEHALWLMRLSNIRYALKQAAAPGSMLDEESERPKLSPRLRALMEPLVRAKPKNPPLAPSRTNDAGDARQGRVASSPDFVTSNKIAVRD